MRINKYIYITLLLLLTQIAQSASITMPLTFDHYYTYDEMNQALKVLHQSYPEFTTIEEVGKSDEGRTIYGLTINNPKTGKAEEKCGVYVDGNIHGNEIQAGEVCLYFANYLLTQYAINSTVQNLVDEHVYYIIPVINVDGRYHFMADANTMHSNRSLRRAKDDDGDGLFDEDPADDLDGDGSITQMRIRDEFGAYKTDPDDPRLMIRVKPGEKGEWSLLGYEGIDNDNDGLMNEDAEGYVDPNRNWGYTWKPDYIQRGAGDYPLSGVGLQSVARFLNERPNVLLVCAFHNNGGMWLGGASNAEEPIPSADRRVYQKLGETAEKITPGYRYMESYELYPTYGDFTSHTYGLLGAYSFVGELFIPRDETFNNQKTEYYKGKSDEIERRDRTELERERLQFNDYLVRGASYTEWKQYEHPQYGTIEIGGWIKYSSRMPATFMLPELVHRNSMAVLSMVQELPKVELELLSKETMDGGLTKVRIRAKNSGFIQNMTTHASENKLYTSDRIVVSNAKLLLGGVLKNQYTDLVNYKENQPEIQPCIISGKSKVDYEFIVSGSGTITFDFESQKAKNCSLKVKL